ncbi:DNA-binding response regulator [candidate division KSB1 bacterium]|nr:MAG: DNA-binding response regulator [candidate division KSB1 bacterium]
MPQSSTLILLIEDEDQIRRFLRATLTAHQFRLLEATTGNEGLQLAASQQPQVIILDLGLPDIDGLEVTKRLREWAKMKIAALDAGADDYLTKPFGVGELLARLRVALRHAARAAGEPEDPVIVLGELRIDLARRQVFLAENEIHLTPIEFKLLAILAKHAGKVLTHQQLLKEVWGQTYGQESHNLRVHIAQLRRKLEADTARPRYLLTEPGVGYRLRDD